MCVCWLNPIDRLDYSATGCCLSQTCDTGQYTVQSTIYSKTDCVSAHCTVLYCLASWLVPPDIVHSRWVNMVQCIVQYIVHGARHYLFNERISFRSTVLVSWLVKLNFDLCMHQFHIVFDVKRVKDD
eukprot:scpid109046/ scgid27119/ 